MPQANQYPPASLLQATDAIYGDQDTGAIDQFGNKIYRTVSFPGRLFGGGNGIVALPPNTFLGNPQSAQSTGFGQPIQFDSASMYVDASGTLRIVPSLADNLTAQGSLQADALTLGAVVNIVTTVNSGTGVVAPALLTGQEFEVWNLGNYNLNLYPLGGGRFASAGVNLPIQIFPGSVSRVRVRSGAAGATVLLAG